MKTEYERKEAKILALENEIKEVEQDLKDCNDSEECKLLEQDIVEMKKELEVLEETK